MPLSTHYTEAYLLNLVHWEWMRKTAIGSLYVRIIRG